jgi:cell division protease FtsH
MDPTLLSLLDSIAQKSLRSKLETHRELIRQLRRKGCTYRDIVRVLNERVGLEGPPLFLFYGPPGTGKTHISHYLAGQLPDHTTLLVTAEQVGLLDHYF